MLVLIIYAASIIVAYRTSVYNPINSNPLDSLISFEKKTKPKRNIE